MRFFRSLPKNDKFYREVDQILETIKANPQVGNRIQYEKIPKCYIAGYDAPNLFRVAMSRGWRLVYTFTGKQNQKTAYVLEAFDHKGYEKRFGY